MTTLGAGAALFLRVHAEAAHGARDDVVDVLVHSLRLEAARTRVIISTSRGWVGGLLTLMYGCRVGLWNCGHDL